MVLVASVRNHIRIQRSPDDVWKVVSDAGAIAEWFPNITHSSASGNMRHVEFDEGFSLEEEIILSDDDLRRFRYRVTEGPTPDTETVATVDVIEDPVGALVIYSTEITPDELAELPARWSADALQALKELLEQ